MNMHNLLEAVVSGIDQFHAASDSESDLEDFQRTTAAVALEACKLGYISSIKLRPPFFGKYPCDAFCVESITPAGLAYLDQIRAESPHGTS